MIQEIAPSKFDITFKNLRSENGDFVMFFNKNGEILVKAEGGRLSFPAAKDSPVYGQIIYLFSAD